MPTKIFPLGARLFVEEIVPEIDLKRRGAAAGLTVIVEEANLPKPTTGRVVALGNDPFLLENLQLGDIVSFNRYAGHTVMVEGHELRQLELQEVTSVQREVTDEVQDS